MPTKPTDPDTLPADLDDFDEDCAGAAAYRKLRETAAKEDLADPAAALRRTLVRQIDCRRRAVDDLSADLRVARLELKAAEAMLLALGPVPVQDGAPTAAPAGKPTASLKAAARATGRKHVE